MKTLLSVVLLCTALGVAAYIWNEEYHAHPANDQVKAVAATDSPKAAESVADEFNLNGAKQRCFDASKEVILKELKAPQTARFPDLGSQVKFQRREADSYLMWSHVDAQNALGAVIRIKWETLFDKNEKLVWIKLDDDELEPLEDVLRRLQGLPSREDERRLAAKEAERATEAIERAREQREQLKDPRYRVPFHAYAQKYVTNKLQLQGHHNIQHSKLLAKDDKYNACYWLGNDIWEATGWVHSIPPSGTRRLRQFWRISIAVLKDNQPQVLDYTFGKDQSEVARIRAGVRPPEKAAPVVEPVRPPVPTPRPLAGDLRPNTTSPSLPSATQVVGPSGIFPRQRVTSPPVSGATPAPAIALATPFPRSNSGVSPPPESGEKWRVYSPGTQPRGRTIAPFEAASLAGSGFAGERLYLSGNFVVSAKGDNKAVLRPRGTDSGSVPVRVIAEFPSASVVPPENEMIARDSSRAFEILDISRAEDGTVNVKVRDITRQQ